MFMWCGIHVTYWFACTAGFDQLLPTKSVISQEAFDEVESARNYVTAFDLRSSNMESWMQGMLDWHSFLTGASGVVTALRAMPLTWG